MPLYSVQNGLDFVGKPIISGTGLSYTPPQVDYVDGGLLDTESLPDLTNDEIATVKQMKAEAKLEIKPESAKKQDKWIAEKVASGVSVETVNRMLTGGFHDLYDDFILEFTTGPVSVADVWENHKAFEGKALADPIEGTSYGTTTAKFYWNNGKPVVNSLAHGQDTKYFLHVTKVLAQEQTHGDTLSTSNSLGRDKDDRIETTIGNVSMAVSDPEFCKYHIGFDEFRDEIMMHRGDFQWRQFDDEHYTQLRITLPKLGFKEVGRELIRDAVHHASKKNKFDSAKEWLNSLEWDGVHRVETFNAIYFGAEDTPYTKAVGKYTWTAMAGRVLDPGCQADMVPILKGGQGLLKLTAVAALSPSPDFFCEISFTENEDNLSRKMRGTLIAELGELRGLHTKDLESIKSFITKKHEKWTPKFKEFTTTFPRRLIFIGTTNQDQFLADSTGNRRWLPFEVTKADRDSIARDRDQLWAEGAVMFRSSGIAWKEAERLASDEYAKFEMVEAWQSPIDTWLHSTDYMNGFDGDCPGTMKGGITTTEILNHCLGIETKRITRAEQMKVGDIMKKLGYTKKRGTHREQRDYFWNKDA